MDSKPKPIPVIPEKRNSLPIIITRQISDSSKNLKQRLNSMSTKKKIIIAVRVSIIFLCSVGLIKQTIELIDQFTIGQTVVNINYENKHFNKLPGITVCYPAAFSMVKVVEKYPHLRPLYEEYIKLVNSMSDEERKNKTMEELLSDIYYYNFTRFIYHGDIYNNGKNEVPIKDLYDMSLPLARDKSGRPTISISINGIPKNGSCNRDGLTDDNPIESLVFKHKNNWNKCFTFYSHLNKKWRDYQMDITKIYITISYNESWFPRKDLMDDGIQLSMHSPDELPRHDVEYYVELRPNRYIKLTYNRWKTELLGEGYQTRCRNYDLDDHQHYYNQMRSDCVKQCIQQKLNKCSDCNIIRDSTPTKGHLCRDCLSLTTVLWTENDFINNRFTRVCDNSFNRSSQYFQKKDSCLLETSLESESKCQSECRPKCVNRYYNYEVKSTSEVETPHKNVTVVTIQHNQLPDQLTRHLPEMTTIQFVSNFGGLLGMWLGLSALAIFKYVLKFFFK